MVIKDEPIEEALYGTLANAKAAIPRPPHLSGATASAIPAQASKSPGSIRSQEARHTRELEDKVNQLEAHLEALQSRCDLALKEIVGLKRKRKASEDESRKRAKPNDDTYEPTSESIDVRVMAQKQEPAEAVEQQNDMASPEARHESRHREPGAFTGALASKTKTKADLMDVARALRLKTTGTKKELLERINVHFNAHPEKRVDPIFAGLFISRRRPPNDENSPLPSFTAPAPFYLYNPNLQAGPPSLTPYAYLNTLPNPSYPAHYPGPAPFPANSYPYYSYIGSHYNLPY